MTCCLSLGVSHSCPHQLCALHSETDSGRACGFPFEPCPPASHGDPGTAEVPTACVCLSLLSSAPSPAPLSTRSHSLSPCLVSTEQVTSTLLLAPQLVPGGLAETVALFPTMSSTPPSLHPLHLLSLSQSHQACPECAGQGGAGEHLCAERVLPALGAGHAGERRGQGRGHPGEPAPPGGSLGWGQKG